MIADLYEGTFEPTKTAITSSCFRRYRNDLNFNYYNPRPDNGWSNPNDVDSVCSLMRALDLYRQPVFDITKANEDLYRQVQVCDAMVETDYSSHSNNEPTQEEKDHLDRLRKEAERALVFQGEISTDQFKALSHHSRHPKNLHHRGTTRRIISRISTFLCNWEQCGRTKARFEGAFAFLEEGC